jgi:hypothetical protein
MAFPYGSSVAAYNALMPVIATPHRIGRVTVNPVMPNRPAHRPSTRACARLDMGACLPWTQDGGAACALESVKGHMPALGCP